jgi:hypothetical protein
MRETSSDDALQLLTIRCQRGGCRLLVQRAPSLNELFPESLGRKCLRHLTRESDACWRLRAKRAYVETRQVTALRVWRVRQGRGGIVRRIAFRRAMGHDGPLWSKAELAGGKSR